MDSISSIGTPIPAERLAFLCFSSLLPFLACFCLFLPSTQKRILGEEWAAALLRGSLSEGGCLAAIPLPCFIGYSSGIRSPCAGL